MMRIVIAGNGITGGAMREWLEKHTMHEVMVYDPPKNEVLEDYGTFDVLLICVPVPTVVGFEHGGAQATHKQDLSLIASVLMRFQDHQGMIYIRSTVLPGTCDYLSKVERRPIYAMPEFLTERRALQDFTAQGVIAAAPSTGPERDIPGEMFPRKRILLVSNREAELAKYAHNCFAAVKVGFFNVIHHYCLEEGADYRTVLEGARMTGFIEAEHTKVPGPDGKFGFGGKCLPKDLAAFVGYIENQQGEDGTQPPGLEMLTGVMHDNGAFRKGQP
jgi:UDP-glucose 6-dehydrogenase